MDAVIQQNAWKKQKLQNARGFFAQWNAKKEH
jgi:hypothetical protein